MFKGWQVTDCEVVAAETAEQAHDWFLKTTGVDAEDYTLEDVREVRGDMVVRDEDDDGKPFMTTIGEIIAQNDESEPYVVCGYDM